MAEHEDNILIKLIKLKVRKWVIIAVAIVIIIIAVCASLLDLDLQNALLPGSPDDENYTEFCPLAYFNSIYVTEKGTLMAETTVQSVWDNDDRYSQYLTDVNSLAYLLNAQVVTQYPYIESASSKDLNGTVKFYRNDSYTPMKYVSESELDKYIDTYNKIGDYELQDKALESFSLNKDGTIKIAYLQEEEDTVTTNDVDAAIEAEALLGAGKRSEDGTYTVSSVESKLYTTNIAYQSLIQNYTLPFELLWSIAVMGDDGSSAAGNSEDLAHAIASMAYDGEIRLIIDDNNNVTTTTDRYTYNIQQRSIYTDTALKIATKQLQKGDNYATGYENVKSCNVTHVNVQTVNSPTIKINLIESWCAVYKNNAKFDSTDKTGRAESNKTYPKDGSWEEKSTQSRRWNYYQCPVAGVKNLFNIDNYKNDVLSPIEQAYITANEHIYQRYQNLTQTTQVDTSSFSYTNGTVTSPAFNKDIADLFNVSSFYSVKSYLCNSGNGYFMEAIEGNTTTANMVDLINYIFNQITETKSYYKGKENFESIWNDINPNTDIQTLVEGSYIVQTNSPGALPAVTKEQYIKAVSGYLKGGMKTNALQITDAVIQAQEQYNVNAFFIIAIARTESGVGTNCHHGADWLSVTIGRKTYRQINTPQDSVMEMAEHTQKDYFAKGKTTIEAIGYTYCPNTPDYPHQGDDWIDRTSKFVLDLYNAAGITVVQAGTVNGDFVQYYQGDYSNVSYGSGTIASCGCGPTSFAMVATHLTGKTITPKDAIDWCGNTYYVSNAGTSWSYFSAAAKHFKLNCTVKQTESITDVETALKNGKLVISSQGPGLFTNGGHYIVLSSIDSNGKISVKDPNKNNAVTKKYNSRLFTATEIDKAAKKYWIFNTK